MRSDEVRLLTDQLAQALDEMDQGHGEPAEVATLGGLLARWLQSGAASGQAGQPALDLAATAAALLERASSHRAPARIALQATIDREGVLGLVQGFMDASETDTEEQRADILFELDELLAASWFCGLQAPELTELTDLVVRTVHAFPATWRDLAALATAMLERHPQLPPPAAGAMWSAVEASRWQADPEPLSVPACSSALRALNLPITISRPRFPALQASLPQADSAILPAPPGWQTVDRGEGWELALTVDEADQLILLLSRVSTDPPVRIEHDGKEVALQTPRPGVVTCLAEPGTYRLHIAGEVRVYEVES